MSEVKASTCSTCGYSWRTGANGNHSCSDTLLRKLELAESVISKVIPSDSNQRQMLHSYKFLHKSRGKNVRHTK